MPSKLASFLKSRFDSVYAQTTLWALVPAVLLILVKWAITSQFELVSILVIWLTATGILFFSDVMFPRDMGDKAWTISGLFLVLLAAILSLLSYLFAWFDGINETNIFVFIIFYAFLLCLETNLSAKMGQLQQWLLRLFLASTAGIFPVLFTQIQGNFSEEELYSFLQSLILAVFYMLLSLCRKYKISGYPIIGKAISISKPSLWIFILVSWGVIAIVSVRSYQKSIYSSSSSTFTGITPETPFVCGEVPITDITYSGEFVFTQLLEQIEGRPNIGVPEYGMLALATGEEKWLALLREHLLIEAENGRFTISANSVKWAQYQAAQRVYYYMRVKQVYPSLFTNDEEIQLESWFKRINKRALTAEWVDWLYAVALSKNPEGPYENQENGASLISLLELSDLADPALSAANNAYLSRTKRGWDARFRNTDDAYTYQMEWLENAYYQSLTNGTCAVINQRLSFDWMLAQALPDGAPLVYNYPFAISPSSTAYMAADLFQDPAMLWWAGQSLAYNINQENVFPRPYPGIEKALDIQGTSPTTGSCLIYGETGLPNQTGGIAPDKIVFRDGWESDSRYMLLNLRFTGWHRYKATNTISLLYQNGPLIEDVQQGYKFSWLPEGRSVVRDKRIPRENLNGFIFEQSGASLITSFLTGVGSRYAQDPPHYAEIVSFEITAEHDISHTRLVDWQGWTHERWVDFQHAGKPILVADKATGPISNRVSVIWHLASKSGGDASRLILREDKLPVEMVVLPVDGVAIVDTSITNESIIYSKRDANHLGVLTLFLFGDWVGAQTERLPTQLRVYTVYQSVIFNLPEEWLLWD